MLRILHCRRTRCKWIEYGNIRNSMQWRQLSNKFETKNIIMNIKSPAIVISRLAFPISVGLWQKDTTDRNVCARWWRAARMRKWEQLLQLERAGQVLDPQPKPPLAKPNLVFNHVYYALYIKSKILRRRRYCKLGVKVSTHRFLRLVNGNHTVGACRSCYRCFQTYHL